MTSCPEVGWVALLMVMRFKLPLGSLGRTGRLQGAWPRRPVSRTFFVIQGYV